MTSEQISHILSDVDSSYVLDEDLDLDKFQYILLNQDANIYIEPKFKRFNFNSDTNILEIYEGRTKYGTFYYNNPNQPNHYVSFDLIAGFIRTDKMLENGQIMYRL